jgi:hypothetical protein
MNSGSSRKIFIALLVVTLLFVATTAAAQTQTSRAATAASYFDRGSEWQAKGELDRASRRLVQRIKDTGCRKAPGQLNTSSADYDSPGGFECNTTSRQESVAVSL